MPSQFEAGKLQAFSSDFEKNVTVLSSCSLIIYTCCLWDNLVVIAMHIYDNYLCCLLFIASSY